MSGSKAIVKLAIRYVCHYDTISCKDAHNPRVSLRGLEKQSHVVECVLFASQMHVVDCGDVTQSSDILEKNVSGRHRAQKFQDFGIFSETP